MANALPRCGRICYTNDLPVYTAIDENVLSFPGVLVADVPARLNDALLQGSLDISPISSAFYAQHADELVLIPGICIGAAAKVLSICCISSMPPSQLAGRNVAVTRESATGRMLFQVLCRKYYRFDPTLADSDDPFAQHAANGTAALLIGDKAIDAAEQAPAGSVHDLGELWYGFTGRGMVYAVWAARADYARQAEEKVRAVARALRESAQWGLENIGHVIERADASHRRAAGFYQEYYRGLRFTLDAAARDNLEAFLASAFETGLLDQVPPLRFIDEVPQHV